MTPEQIDHVFGRGRLKMETGAHVEVFREAAPPGESRRYTKRFLTTADGDYAQWTEREWRILALLVGHGSRCVPDIVQYDRDARGTKLVQTYDAGATVDQWATLLPVERDGGVYARVFEDCAHWWALAHHCLVALDEIHSLQLVHLDIKGDNICIPIGPAEFDPAVPEARLFPVFGKLRLIDFAFSLVSGESLPTPLPIGWQQDYDYQSPRLLHALEAGRAGDLRPTENLDWRCDMYSLAAMLKRYLPGAQRLCQPELACGWSAARYDAAKALILRIREAHDHDLTSRRPHAELIVETSAHVRANELAQSLEQGWMLARDAQPFAVPATPLTPVTRLALPLRLVIPPRDDVVAVLDAVWTDEHRAAPSRLAKRRDGVPLVAAAMGIAAVSILLFVTDSGAFLGDAARLVMDAGRSLHAAMNRVVAPEGVTGATASTRFGTDKQSPTSPAGTPDAAATPEVVAAAASAAAEADTASTVASEASPASDVAQSPAPESESTMPPDSSSASPTSALPSASPPAGGSRNKPGEGYRSKPVSPPPRIAKAPSSPPPTAARTLPFRPAEAVPRTQLTSVSKSPRVTTATRVVATAPAQTIATKKAGDTTFVAARVPPLAPTTPVASGATTAPASNSAADEERRASIALNAGTTSAGVAAQSAPTAPSAPQIVASLSPSSQPAAAPRVAALPLAPPPPALETPRASPAVTSVAPAVTSAAPMVPPPRTPLLEAPRPPPRMIAEQPRLRASPGESRDGDAYRTQARWILENIVPRTSAQAHAQISRVLLIAASAYHPDQDRAVTAAAASLGVVNDTAFVARDFAPLDARRFHDEARHAYWSRRDMTEALDLQLKAFGANPYDPEIAGHLAFLYMKVLPAQPDRARQLALHAIGLRNGNGQNQTGRTEDWTTFAIASALTGRETDAKHGFYALVALTRNADRVCHVARSALAIYGEQLREPVDALLYRLHAQGRGDDSPNCARPATYVTRNP